MLGTSLLLPDYLLLALYVVSMYFSVRFSSPAMDEQQAQQQKIMALVSPMMIAFIGRSWPSALILYWLTFNLLTMGQQMYLMRRFRAAPAAAAAASAQVAANGAVAARGAIEQKPAAAGAGSGRPVTTPARLSAASGAARSQRFGRDDEEQYGRPGTPGRRRGGRGRPEW